MKEAKIVLDMMFDKLTKDVPIQRKGTPSVAMTSPITNHNSLPFCLFLVLENKIKSQANQIEHLKRVLASTGYSETATIPSKRKLQDLDESLVFPEPVNMKSDAIPNTTTASMPSKLLHCNVVI